MLSRNGSQNASLILAWPIDSETHQANFLKINLAKQTSGSAIAEGPRDVLVSRNSATTKYRYRVALFA